MFLHKIKLDLRWSIIIALITLQVSDLLREQLYLQSELSYDGSGAVDTPTSARSSRSGSPVRSHDPNDITPSLSRRSGGVYRSTVSLTPSIPPRSVTESQERTTTPSMSPSLSEVRGRGLIYTKNVENSRRECWVIRKRGFEDKRSQEQGVTNTRVNEHKGLLGQEVMRGGG